LQRVSLMLFTRMATSFDSIQLLCQHLKSLEANVLTRVLFEANLYLRYIWVGSKKSLEEAERRARLYDAWEYREDKKILDMVKRGDKFSEKMQRSYLQHEALIKDNYKKAIQLFPELSDKNRTSWYGCDLRGLSCRIDKAYGNGDAELWYNTTVRYLNMVTHSSSKISAENLEETESALVLKYGGNESQMLSVLLISFFIYRSTLLTLDEIFQLGLTEKIKTFDDKQRNTFDAVNVLINNKATAEVLKGCVKKGRTT
jgi:hypothetical protein